MANIGFLTTAGCCLFDFINVPSVLNSDYNSKGEALAGKKNWNGAFKEIGKSIPKCAASMLLPLAIGGLAVSAGPILATVASVASFVAPMGSYSLLEKLLPSEKELIAEAKEAKGIVDNQEEQKTYLA